MVNALCLRFGFALIALGAMLGLVPGFTGEVGSFGGGLSCGSPFIVSDDLTGAGIDACETGGLSDRRAWALGTLAAGVVLLFAGAAKPASGSKSAAAAPDSEQVSDGWS